MMLTKRQANSRNAALLPSPESCPAIDVYKRQPYDPSVKYSREPQTIDVSVGKTDPLYKAHSYHTKVPHLAIVPSILHYTEPGDIVLDGFGRCV